jgi:3-phenylpropionate/trans-cinnamate dioxygenase ferredoxin subunit
MTAENPRVVGRINSGDFEVGDVAPVSDRVCAIRTSAGFFAVQRMCPHAGADLANGYEEGGSLRCAWHNIPFDLETGRSPLESVRDLEVYPVRRVGPETYEVLDRE